MSKSKKENLLNELLNLSPIDRVEIIEKVLSSFEYEGRSEIDRLWSEEAENRISEYESGKIKSRSYKDVLNDINQENY